MTKTVWEDTLIFALRDLQWRKAIASCRANPNDIITRSQGQDFPGMLLKFDGNAESKVGDVMASTQDQRYFLIEFKAGEQEVAAEWDGKGKYLYHFLSALCNHTRNKNPLVQATAKRMIRICLSAHHLAYWTKGNQISTVLSTGAISCLPYLEGVKKSLRPGAAKIGIRDYGYVPAPTVQMTIDEFFNSKIRSHKYQDSSDGTKLIDVKPGIDIHKMQTYLEWLAHDKNDDSVKIALVDSELQVVAISPKLSDLLAVVNALITRPGPTYGIAFGGTRKKSKQGAVNSPLKEQAKDVARLAHLQAARAVARLSTKN